MVSYGKFTCVFVHLVPCIFIQVVCYIAGKQLPMHRAMFISDMGSDIF